MASNLGGREIYKYEWRTQRFIEKYSKRISFDLTSGRKVQFIPQNAIIEALKKEQPTTNLKLLGIDGKYYKFTDLAKSKDFGGKGEGAGTLKEDRQLISLKNQIEQAKIVEKYSTIKINIKNKIYEVFDVVSTPGTPKSDFHLIDVDGKEIVWISHKDGKTAKDFQQWGGISQSKEPTIYGHIEVQNFIKDLKTNFKDGLPPATTLYRKIKDLRLKMLSVYGNGYRGPLGRQNVTLLLQGEVKLLKKNSSYILDAYNVHYNGDEIDGLFEPVLMAVYKGDRSDAGVKGTRIVIAPIGGRKGKEFNDIID